MYRYYNDYLMHYGVKGMKWGVRHDPVRTYTITKNPPSGYTVKDPLRGEQYRLRSKDSSKNKKIERKAQRAGRRAEYQYNKAYKRNATKKQSLNEGLAAYERKRNELERKDSERAEKKARKNFNRHWVKTYNKAANQFNSKIGDINKRYNGKDLGDRFETKTGQKYVKELNKAWQTEYKKAIMQDYGEYGKMFVDEAPSMNSYAIYIKK